MKDNEKMERREKPSKEERKLAAIMFTDIEGFTHLMAKNESTTIHMLEEQTRLMKDLISQHRGRLVKTMGDAVMADFNSAVSAVRCAIEMQGEIRRCNENRPDAQKLMVRIGIHVGDVVIRGKDIFGDGVNIAARIEPFAEAGEICMSRAVYEQVKNKVSVPIFSLGLKELKNIEEPLEIYKVMMEGALPAEAVKKAATEPSEAINSIAVLPFVDMSPQKDQEYFCDGMTEEIINALTKLENLRVVARTSAFAFKDKHEDIREIGKKLNVKTLLEGSVRKAGNKLRISAQLIKVADGYHLWSERYDRDMEDIFAVQDEISLAIVGKLKVKFLEKEGTGIVKRHTEDLDAYNLYLKGRFFLNKRTEKGLNRAIEYFKQAIEKDSDYAVAYAGLADSYFILPQYSSFPQNEALPKAKEAVLRALNIDKTLAEAYASLGMIKGCFDWDWEAAEKEFKQAIELNPGCANSHYYYAFYLMVTGRFEEAIKEMKRAQELDPLSLVINRNLGLLFYLARQYDRTIDQVYKTIEMDPNFSYAHLLLGEAFMQESMYEEALAEFQKEKDISGIYNPIGEIWSGITYAKMCKKGAAQDVLDQVMERARQKHMRIHIAHVAALCFVLGKKDMGFEWLDKAYQECDPWLLLLKGDPVYDSVRSDPRYTALLKKMGLEK